MVSRLRPSVWKAMMHASEISAAISPYSIAVAPLWSANSLVPRMIRLFLSRSSAAVGAAHRPGGEGADAVAAGAFGFVKRLVGLVHQRRQAGAGGADREADAQIGSASSRERVGRSV